MAVSEIGEGASTLYCVFSPGVSPGLLRRPIEALWGEDAWHSPTDSLESPGRRGAAQGSRRCRPAAPVLDWLLMADPPSGACHVSRFQSLWLAGRNGVTDLRAVILLGHPLWRAVEVYQRILGMPAAPLHGLAKRHSIGAFYLREEARRLGNPQCQFFAAKDPLDSGFGDGEPDGGEEPGALASRAIEAVEAASLWVGLADRLAVDAPMLSRTLADEGYDLAFDRLIPAAAPTALRTCSEEDLNGIGRAHAADVILCNHFRGKLEAEAQGERRRRA